MPFQISHESDGVYARVSGRITTDEILRLFESLGADPGFDDLLYLIADFRDVTELHLTADGIAEIAALNYAQALTNPRLLCAGVATDLETVAFLKHWMTIQEPAEKVAQFATVAEARMWIGKNAGRILSGRRPG